MGTFVDPPLPPFDLSDYTLPVTGFGERWTDRDGNEIHKKSYIDSDLLAWLLAEIEACGYECQAGALANNVAWVRLRELAGIGGAS